MQAQLRLIAPEALGVQRPVPGQRPVKGAEVQSTAEVQEHYPALPPRVVGTWAECLPHVEKLAQVCTLLLSWHSTNCLHDPVLSAGILPIKAVVNCGVHVVQAVAG